MPQTVLLHCCCAPCSSAIIEWMLQNDIRPILYYCNPNIFPEEEYLIRKTECTRYAQLQGLEIIDEDYNHPSWASSVQGHEQAPERGSRCLVCFRYRLLRAAECCKRLNIPVFTTTLASSRWKSLEQISVAGHWAAEQVGGVEFDDRNWRKGGLQQRRNELLRVNNFYNQVYCGCEYSLNARLPYMQKSDIRKWVKQLGKARSQSWEIEQSHVICRKVISSEQWRTSSVILLYHSLPHEVNTSLLIDTAHSEGKTILLPKVVGDNLELYIYSPDSLQPGAYGIMEPTGDLFPIDRYAEITLAIIPGLAFTPSGARLGRGKGYYDRLLPQLTSAYRMGLCFSYQHLSFLPTEEHDILMHTVIAE